MRLIRALWAVLLLVLACPGQNSKPSVMFAVNGVVVGPDGSPLTNAQVCAQPLDDVDGAVFSLHWVSTDENGKFRLLLPPGRYELRAKNEHQGFPDPSFLLNADANKSVAITVRDSDLSRITVQLATRGATLRGEVSNSDGIAVANATVTIADFRSPEAYVELTTDKAGGFEFAIPAKQVRISARASGYQRANYNDGNPLEVKPGEVLNLKLVMKRN